VTLLNAFLSTGSCSGLDGSSSSVGASVVQLRSQHGMKPLPTWSLKPVSTPESSADFTLSRKPQQPVRHMSPASSSRLAVVTPEKATDAAIRSLTSWEGILVTIEWLGAFRSTMRSNRVGLYTAKRALAQSEQRMLGSKLAIAQSEIRMLVVRLTPVELHALVFIGGIEHNEAESVYEDGVEGTPLAPDCALN